MTVNGSPMKLASSGGAAELQKIHRYVIDTEVIVEISDERRAVIEVAWPELVYRMPPQE